MNPEITWTMVLNALTVLAVAIVIGWVVRFAVRQILLWRGRGTSSSRVFSQVARWIVLVLGLATALTVVFPSVQPVDVLGGVTIISIAAGIAFQTVLGNMFAGLVLLAQDRFRIGDQIHVKDIQGTVQSIGLSSTVVKTFDARLVVIPNVVVHSDVVTVQTGYEVIRSSVEISLDEETDLLLARQVAVEAMELTPGIHTDPAPSALLTTVGAATVTLELRFWSGARQLETNEARDAVILHVLSAFVERGVKTGSDAVVIEPGPQMKAMVSGATTADPLSLDD